MSKTAKNDSSIPESVFSSLQNYWSQFSVSQEIREVYQQLFQEVSIDLIIKLVDFELKSFQSNSSLLVVCIKSVETREQSFAGIRDMDQYLRDVKGWEKDFKIITQCAEILQGHRMITLTCIENIIRWSSQIFYFTRKVKEFRNNHKNYLEKIKADSVFTQFCEMEKFFMFSQKNDPLLIALTESANLKFSTKFSNYFIKANKFSIPVPPSMSSKVFEMQKMINSGFDEVLLIEQAGNFSLILQNQAEELKIKNEKMKESLSNFLLSRLIEDTIDFLLYSVVISQTDIALSKIILFKYLDMTKALKGIVEESIKELKTKKSQENDKIKYYPNQEHKINMNKTKNNSIGKSELPREDSKKTIKSITSFAVESTRPSVTLTINDGENPLHKLIIESRSVKAKNSPIFSKIPKNTPEILKPQENPTTRILKSQFFYEKSNESISRINKSLKIRIKSSLNSTPVVKNSNFRIQNNEISKDREKSPKSFLNTSHQINEIRYISTKSPLKRKIGLLEERKFDQFKIIDSKDSRTPTKQNAKLSPIFPETKSSTLKQDLNFFVLTEGIYRNFVETIIKEQKIQELAENCFKELIITSPKVSSKEKDIILAKVLLWKLQTEIFDSILESFLSQTWLFDLVSLIKTFSGSPGRSRINSVDSENYQSEVLEDAEDFVHEVFTPVIHSPNQILSRIDSVSEKTSQSSLPNSRESQFMRTRESLSLNLLKSTLKDLNHFFSSYLSKLPKDYQHFYYSFEKTLEFSLTGEDISWLSFNHEDSFKGVLGFCALNEKGKKIALVFHVSTWEKALIGNLMKETLNFLKRFKFSSAIFLFKEIPEEVKSVAKELGLVVELKEMKVFARFSQETVVMSNSVVLNVKTTCSENVLVGFQGINKTMIEFGSHSFLAFHLFSLLGNEDDFFEDRPQVRLQQELKDLLELLNSEKEKKDEIFPYSHSTSGIFQKSKLELSFNWAGMSRFPHSTGFKTFLFFNFHQVQHWKTEHFSIFYLKTNDPNLEVSLIIFPNLSKELDSEMKSLKTDIFLKAENILKSAEEKIFLKKELCVPGFCKNVDWEVTWMKGFGINRESSVSSCFEQFSWNASLTEEVCSSVGPGRKEWILDHFIVAIIDRRVWNVLEVPLAVALITENDWIQV
jgi:hypothetical protein